MFSIIKDYLIKHRLPSWTGHMGVIFDDTIEWWGTSHRGVFFDDRFGCSESTLNEIKLLFKKEGVQFRFRGGAYFYIDPDDSQEYIQDPDYWITDIHSLSEYHTILVCVNLSHGGVDLSSHILGHYCVDLSSDQWFWFDGRIHWTRSCNSQIRNVLLRWNCPSRIRINEEDFTRHFKNQTDWWCQSIRVSSFFE